MIASPMQQFTELTNEINEINQDANFHRGKIHYYLMNSI